MARVVRLIPSMVLAALVASAAVPCAHASPHRHRHHAAPTHVHHRVHHARRRGRQAATAEVVEALPAPPPSGLAPSVEPVASPPVALPANSGTVTVAVAQASDVSIDGRAYGRTPTAAIALPAGPHVVVIRNGERHWVHTVHFDLSAGERRDIHVDLDAI